MIGMHNIPSVRFFSTESVDFFNVKCQHWLVVVLYLIVPVDEERKIKKKCRKHFRNKQKRKKIIIKCELGEDEH